MGNAAIRDRHAIRGRLRLAALCLAAITITAEAQAGLCRFAGIAGEVILPSADCIARCYNAGTYTPAHTDQAACEAAGFTWADVLAYTPDGSATDPTSTTIANDVLTVTEGGSSVSDIAAAATRLRAKIDNYQNRLGSGDLTAVFDVIQEAGIDNDVTDLINQVTRYGCLAGIGASFFTGSGGSGGSPPGETGLPPDEDASGSGATGAFFGGGGLSVAALVPLLKDLLGGQARQLLQQAQQLCHQRSIEATSKGQVRLQGEILKSLHTPVAQAAIFTPATGVGAQSQYEAFLVSNPVDTTGTQGELMQRILAAQVGQTRALLLAQQQATGGAVLSEFGAPPVAAFGSYTTMAENDEGDDAEYISSASDAPCRNADMGGSAVGEEIVGSCYQDHCRSLNGRFENDFDDTRPWRLSNFSIFRQWRCEGAQATGTDADATLVRAEQAPEYYPFDEGSTTGAANYWDEIAPEPDIVPDILTAADVTARPATQGAQAYTRGRCSIAAAETELECVARGGTWTAGTGTNTLPGGAASCIAAYTPPAEDANAERTIASAARSLRSYATERLRQSDFGVFLCALVPDITSASDTVCFPADGTDLISFSGWGSSAGFDVPALCLAGSAAPEWSGPAWTAIATLMLAVAGLVSVRMWI